MKNILVLLIILIFSSCRENKKKSFIDKVHPNDTICLNEIEKAKKDIKNEKLYHCESVGGLLYIGLRCEKELDSLLNLNKIGLKLTASSDVVDPNRTYDCYCQLMQEKINEKFGKTFIDSLLFKADSLYVLKNLDKVFEYSSYANGWDKPPLYPNDTSYDVTNHSGLQKAFENAVRYPKDYVFRKNKRPSADAYISIHLIMDENGKAKVTDSYVGFWNSQTKKSDYRNEKHYDYLRKLTTELVENVKWTPAKVKNVNVKSKSNVYIYFK